MEIPVTLDNIFIPNGHLDTSFRIYACAINSYSDKYSDELASALSRYMDSKYANFRVATSEIDVGDAEKGRQFVFIGEFKEHPKYGWQFQLEYHYSDIPIKEEGLIEFLKTLPNIGESRARDMFNRYDGSEGVIDVLENHIDRLIEINGITLARIPAIKKMWEKEKSLKDLYEFATEHGINNKLIRQAYKKWGDKTKDNILENPYCLTEIRGIGFLIADKLAHGMDKNDQGFRIEACIDYVLKEQLYRNGNLCIPYTSVKNQVATIIHDCDATRKEKMSADECYEIVPKVLRVKPDRFAVVKVRKDKGNHIYVYLHNVWLKEQYISKSIYERTNEPCKPLIGELELDTLINNIEERE